MYTLFISDLHLSQDTPLIAKNFLSLMSEKAPGADAIYILGDMFEYWLGDDGIVDQHQPFIQCIKQITDQKIPVYFMHGNRDFLIAEEFARLTGVQLLDDPTVIDLYGTPTLLTHGDLLCTDDHAYMAFRNTVRNPQWQAQFLSMSMPDRIALAKKARDVSQNQNSEYSSESTIADANENTVVQFFKDAGVWQMIHGHTHRPAVHEHKIDGKPAKRIVLGDWHEKSSYLIVNKEETVLHDPRL